MTRSLLLLVTAAASGVLGTLYLCGFRSLSGRSQFMRFAVQGPRHFPRYDFPLRFGTSGPIYSRVTSDGLFSLPARCHTSLMRTMVSARLPNDLVARMDQTGQRSAVIVAALRAYLRRKPASAGPASVRNARSKEVVQG